LAFVVAVAVSFVVAVVVAVVAVFVAVAWLDPPNKSYGYFFPEGVKG
jgi:hypothetical protein